MTPITQFLTVSAELGQASLVTASAGDVSVKATGDTGVINVGGQVSVGGSNGIGGTAASSAMTNVVTADIGDGSTLNATGAVNVKAKTGERVGHIGRAEAVAC